MKNLKDRKYPVWKRVFGNKHSYRTGLDGNFHCWFILNIFFDSSSSFQRVDFWEKISQGCENKSIRIVTEGLFIMKIGNKPIIQEWSKRIPHSIPRFLIKWEKKVVSLECTG